MQDAESSPERGAARAEKRPEDSKCDRPEPMSAECDDHPMEDSETSANVKEERTPLPSRWVWSFKPTIEYKHHTPKAWLAGYKQLLPAAIADAETFWSVYDGLPAFASLDFGNIYAFFRAGVEPVWEHAAHVDGFSLVVYLPRHVSAARTDRYYYRVLLALVADQAGPCNGCTLERKPVGDKIVMWYANVPPSANGAACVDQAFTLLLEVLALKPDQVFRSAERKGIDWRDRSMSRFQAIVATVWHRRRAKEPQRVATKKDGRSASRRRGRGRRKR